MNRRSLFKAILSMPLLRWFRPPKTTGCNTITISNKWEVFDPANGEYRPVQGLDYGMYTEDLYGKKKIQEAKTFE